MQELQEYYNVYLDAFQFGEKTITIKQMEKLMEAYEKTEKLITFEEYVFATQKTQNNF